MDYVALKNELALPAYAGMTDLEAAVAINAKSRPLPVPSIDVKRYLHVVGKWAGVKQAALHGTGASQLAAISLVDALADIGTFDLQNATYLAAITARLDELVTAGLITSENKTAVLELGNNRRSRAEELGWFVGVGVGDISNARNA